MDRKVKLSIRIKIIAVVSALVLVSLGLYLFVALRLFNDDKTAYVFQATSETATSIRTQAETYVARLLKDSLNIYNLLVDRDLKPEDEREPLSLKEALPKRAATLGIPGTREMTADARAAFDKQTSSAKDPLRPRLALLYLRDGKAEEASRILFPPKEDDEAGVELAKQSADWLLAAGLIHERRRLFAEAEQALAAFVKSHKKDPRLHAAELKLGDLAARNRKYDRAEAYYRAASSIEDAELAAYAGYRLAWALWHLGRPKAAIEQMTRVLRLGKLLPARIKSAMGGDVEAIVSERYETSLEAAKTFFIAYEGLAKAKLRIERVATAVQRLKETPKGKPQATTVLESKLLLRNLFYGDPDLVEFTVYDKLVKKAGKPRRLVRLVNKEYLSESNLKPDYLDRVDKDRPVDFARVTPQKPLLQNSSMKDGMGLLTLVRQDPLTSRFMVLRFKMDHFLSMFGNPVYTSFLADSSGALFAHRDPQKLVTDVNMLDEKYVVDAIKSGQGEGTREQETRAGDTVIVAYSGLDFFNLYAFVEIKRDKAFQAARILTERSIYFGLFFIVVAIFIGIIFARSLTTPIDKLFKGTQVIAAGKFEERVLVETGDEIGILADSFNFMASRIVALLGQEKDKVRMEEELKVAKLVQDSFFPANHMVLGRVEVSAFYTPAAECGGDWWGCVPVGQRVMLLIGDATGHGVPAALITATAASCCTTVKELAASRPELLDSPAEIMRLLNKAVYGAAQGKILMTFFIAIIDPVTRTVTYSNASHNPPYLYKFKERDPDKKDLRPLQDAVSLRLGHKPDTTYTDATSDVGPGDVVVMFTDGFVECTNKEKDEYGNRRFIKSVLKLAKTPTEEIRDGIVKAAMDHYAGHPLGDDLTLVCAKVHPEGVVIPEPVPAAPQAEATEQTETTTTAA